MIRLPPSRAIVIILFGVSGLTTGCGGGGRSSADTLSATAAPASSTQAKAPDTAPDSAPAAPTVGGGPVVRRPTAGKTASGGPATTKKPAATPTAQSKPPSGRDTTIIGWDSVIRFPVRTLPAATSTPTR